jgi:methyltransferase family protein
MSTRTARSLRHEYGLYIELEIENYKESIPRSAILAIGDEAAAKLAAEAQFVLTELLLLEEVDRIIFRRLRLPKYDTWRRRRLKLHEEMRRPEHWGLSASDAVVRTIGGASENGATSHVLVAGEGAQRSALFLAANGCDVTAIEPEADSVQRVMEAAIQAGLAERVHAFAAELTQWTPDAPLQAVVCSHSALSNLSARERARVIAVLQSATADGGVHLVETILAGASAIDELRDTYRGWEVSVEAATGSGQIFLARKEAPLRPVSH